MTHTREVLSDSTGVPDSPASHMLIQTNAMTDCKDRCKILSSLGIFSYFHIIGGSFIHIGNCPPVGISGTAQLCLLAHGQMHMDWTTTFAAGGASLLLLG